MFQKEQLGLVILHRKEIRIRKTHFHKNIRSGLGLLISENEYFYILEAQQIDKEYEEVIFLPGSLTYRYHPYKIS